MSRRLAAFVLVVACTCPSPAAAGESENVARRGDFANSRLRFERDREGHVAFLGGSITEMDGYRPMVTAWLSERFPNTKFQFTNAGIASTCSTTGAFRLERDVLSRHGVVDLLLVEFAVNDDQDAGHARREAMRGMEGILRHVREANPRTDVVVTYFVNPGMLELIRRGRTPVSIAAHEAVAKHYGVSTVYLAKEVADRIDAGELTWEVYGGTHPKPAGNRLAADLVIGLLSSAWSGATPGTAEEHVVPEALDDDAYSAGRLLPAGDAQHGSGWIHGVPDWKSIPGSLRARFAGRPMLATTTPGAIATLPFTGRAVGAYVLAGPDAGTAEARVDGGEWRSVDLYHSFSKGLHYPRTVMFFTDLDPGPHVLEVRTSAESNRDSRGTAIRVLGWAVNGE